MKCATTKQVNVWSHMCLSCFFLYFILPKPMKLRGLLWPILYMEKQATYSLFHWPHQIELAMCVGVGQAEGPCIWEWGGSLKHCCCLVSFSRYPDCEKELPFPPVVMLIRKVLLFLQCCWPSLLLHWMLHPMWGFIQVMEELFFPFPCQGAFLGFSHWLSSQCSLNFCRKVLCKLLMKLLWQQNSWIVSEGRCKSVCG